MDTPPFHLFFEVGNLVSFQSERSRKRNDTLSQVLDTTNIDTTRIDTTLAPSEPKDTIPPHIPLKNHGSISLLGFEPYYRINKEEIQQENYSTLTDLLNIYLPSYPLSLGAFGQFNHISLFGATPKDIALKFDGRRLNDIEYGSFNLELIPVEFIESAEVLIGTDAIVLSNNASGAAINIQEIKYNTAKPYTRIWLNQAAGDFFGSDGIFSQNFAKNWNGTLGFRRMSYTGRFDNSDMDSWNLRALLRWNVSERLNMSLSEIFTNHKLQTNGGIDPNSEAFYDPILATVNFQNLNERVYRHDLTFTISSYIGEDTTSAISGNLYFTRNEWQKGRSEESYLSPSDSLDFYSYFNIFFGSRINLETEIFNAINLKAGGELNYHRSPETLYSQGWRGISFHSYAWGSYNFLDLIELKGGTRFSNEFGRTALSFGGAIRYNLNSVHNSRLRGEELGNENSRSGLSFDASISNRIPTLTEGIELTSEKTIFAILYFDLIANSNKVKAGIFSRQIYDPILNQAFLNNDGKIVNLNYYNATTRTILGLYAEYSQKIFEQGLLIPIFDSDFIKFDSRAQLYRGYTNTVQDSRFPQYYASASLEYHSAIGNSTAYLGLNAKIIGERDGEYFLPQKRDYVSASQTPLSQLPVMDISPLAWNGLDIYISLKLGNANVRLAFENLFSYNYYYIPIYPQLDRNLRLSVSWAFFD